MKIHSELAHELGDKVSTAEGQSEQMGDAVPLITYTCGKCEFSAVEIEQVNTHIDANHKPGHTVLPQPSSIQFSSVQSSLNWVGIIIGKYHKPQTTTIPCVITTQCQIKDHIREHFFSIKKFSNYCHNPVQYRVEQC